MHHMEDGQTQASPSTNSIWGPLALVLALLSVASWSTATLIRERQKVSEMAVTNQTMAASLTQLQSELQSVSARTYSVTARTYYEFQIEKSRRFQRAGPLRLSLRKVDFRHKSFDLAMLVDDNQVRKKNVTLNETVRISLADRPQPLELVVNKIGRNQIRGYVSEPKNNQEGHR